MGEAVRTLHRLTSYTPEFDWSPPVADPRVVSDLEVNDLSRLPWFYKRYNDELDRVLLPRELPSTAAPAVAVMAGTAGVPRGGLDLAQLARILHLSAGVVRTTQRPYGVYLFRAAGSAGGRFPLEVYVAVPDGHGLPAGVYWYHPQDHVLLRVGPAPRGEAPALVVTGVPWRTGWRYRERGYRHIYWDAGSMLAQTLAAADSAGVPASLYTDFHDGGVAALVGADTVHEFPVAVVALGGGVPAIEPTGPAAIGEVDRAPLEFPLITAAQAAGERHELGAAWDRGEPVDVPAGDGRTVEQVTLTRGSQRRMDPTQTVPAVTLQSAMAVALRGVTIPHFVAVHGVDGMQPGLYRWPTLDHPIRVGNLRDELYRACVDQGLGREAAYVVIAATDIATLDDRQYREAQLAAGVVSGRLHLMAYALGASATGMTFADSLLPELLGEQLHGLLFTCVGVPAYRSAVGGQPGAPTSIRMVTPDSPS